MNPLCLIITPVNLLLSHREIQVNVPASSKSGDLNKEVRILRLKLAEANKKVQSLTESQGHLQHAGAEQLGGKW